jgi:transcriptional regulator with XRE-family HTH domain
MVEVQKEWAKMIISNNIKKHREAQHFTQEELANRMHISRQSISKWERGDALPSIENLIALSELLDLS